MAGCAGYRIKKEPNPFAQYDIESLAIPMFINRSAFPLVSGYFTSEIRMMLSEFPELKLSGGEGESEDAVLVGIIDSPQSLVDALTTTGTVFVSDDLKSSIGDRPAFYLPTQGTANLYLTLVLIKKPTNQDRELMTSHFLPYLDRHPRVVFRETFDLNSSFVRSIQETLGPDSPGAVNATRNKKILDRALRDMALQASSRFKQVVIYAF